MNKLLYGVLLCLSALVLVNSQSTPVEQCTQNDGPLPLNFYVQGCTGSPCQVIAFTSANMEAVFRVPNYSRTLTPGVTIIIGDAVTPFILPPAVLNGCEMLQNGLCPVQPGEILKYNFILDLGGMPPMPIIPILEFTLSDETGVAFCVSLHVQLTWNIG